MILYIFKLKKVDEMRDLSETIEHLKASKRILPK